MDNRIKTRRITVDTRRGPITAEYLAVGQGSPVLLLHGVADSAHSWQGVMPFLASGHTLYAPSLPGFGRSDALYIDYSPAFFTEFIVALMDRLGLERAKVIGHSLGGLIALRLALDHPARVSDLALIGSAGLGYPASLAVRGLTLPGIREAMSLWYRTWPGAWQWTTGLSQLLFAQPWLITWSWYERMYRMALRRGYLEATLSALIATNTESEIVLDQLHRLPQPVLVLWGNQDLIFPVWQGWAAVERLHRGRLVVLPGCGHAAQVEQPARVAAALGEFFRAKTEPAARRPVIPLGVS